jgi:hypothetical protein
MDAERAIDPIRISFARIRVIRGPYFFLLETGGNLANRAELRRAGSQLG